MFKKKHVISAAQPIQTLVDKSIKDLKDNSKAIEEALEKFLGEEGIEISQQEFNEIQSLTNTINDLDYTLLKLSEPQPKKKKPKKKKKTAKKKTSKSSKKVK